VLSLGNCSKIQVNILVTLPNIIEISPLTLLAGPALTVLRLKGYAFNKCMKVSKKPLEWDAD